MKWILCAVGLGMSVVAGATVDGANATAAATVTDAPTTGATATKVVEVPGQGITLELPTTWTERTAQDVAYAAGDKATRCSMQLRVIPNPKGLPMNKEAANSARQGMLGSLEQMGATVQPTGEGPLTIHGVPFYKMEVTVRTKSPEPIYLRLYMTAANGNFYLLVMGRASKNTDEGLAAIAESFTFKTPPVLPGAGAKGQ